MSCFHDWCNMTAVYMDKPPEYHSMCRKCGEIWRHGHIQNSLARRIVNFILRK